MAQLEPYKKQIESHGASLVYIAAERRGGLKSPEGFLARNPIDFPFLVDEDRSVTKAYGVHHRIGLDAFDIARPATFVIDQSGIIRFIHVGASQTDRAPVGQLLDSLRQLVPK